MKMYTETKVITIRVTNEMFDILSCIQKNETLGKCIQNLIESHPLYTKTINEIKEDYGEKEDWVDI